MSKFTITREYKEPLVKNTIEFEEVVLYRVLEHMEDFLRGCGFVFKGHLEIVEEKEEENGT